MLRGEGILGCLKGGLREWGVWCREEECVDGVLG